MLSLLCWRTWINGLLERSGRRLARLPSTGQVFGAFAPYNFCGQ